MNKAVLFLLTLLVPVALLAAACGAEATPAPGLPRPPGAPTPTPAPAALGSEAFGLFPWGTPAPAAVPAPVPTTAPAPAVAVEKADQSLAAASAFESAGRQVISTASVSVEVENVPQAIAETRAIAEGLGGFLQQLSSSGDADRQQATITLRVPQAEFFTALERIEALGTILRETVGSEDVTEQFIDLEARLESAQREERSLLSLLERITSIQDILTIERELSRVRSEIERVQGQLNFLERRVDLATITVSLSLPKAEVVQPPSGSMSVEVQDVTDSGANVKGLVSTLGGSVDEVFLSVGQSQHRATMSIRVPVAEFSRAVQLIEKEGTLLSKELRERSPAEGAGLEPQATTPPSDDDASMAPIGVSLFQASPSPFPWEEVTIGILGGVALAAVAASLFLYLRRGAGTRPA